MSKLMNMTILTPECILFEGTVNQARFPGMKGSFTILPRHANLISALTSGKITCMHEGKSLEWDINGGMVEVSKNRISAYVEKL